MDLPGPTAEDPSGHAGYCVLLLEGQGDAHQTGYEAGRTSGIPPGHHHQTGPEPKESLTGAEERPEQVHHDPQILQDHTSPEPSHGKKEIFQTPLRKNPSLQSTLSPQEEGPDFRMQALEPPRQGQRRIQVSPRPTT
jgi:hypothetical protein